ncbi:MAG: carboxypeptidase-like regulatory domain-containing protein [Bacteroidales bacterium]|nr:carboxypeptidase-like regulatory domain-containing protein [Bacteroidales bacterium]
MKTLINYLIKTSLTIVLLFSLSYVYSYDNNNWSLNKKNKQSTQDDTLSYYTFKGKVIDMESKNPLIFATVILKETNVATVTNTDGEFILKVNKSEKANELDVSFIGYKNKKLMLSSLKPSKNIIKLEPATVTLNEIKIRPENPEKLIEAIIKNIPKNYSDIPNRLTAFYRETIKKKEQYVSISEAVLEVYKAPYDNSFKKDLVKIHKGRKSTDVKKMDTVLFKVKGGPSTTLLLDIIKNPYLILSYDYLKYYDYELVNIIKHNEKLNYVIQFSQKPDATFPMFEGKLYVDVNSLAISTAEFSLNLDDKEKASRVFVRKKPFGMKLTPERTYYHVNYREQNGKWYFNYARGEVKFKCNWKKRMFNTVYTTMTEIAITDRDENNVYKFGANERINIDDIFTDKIGYFSDINFWGEYNYIEPNKSIEIAIRKINKKFKK